MEKANQKIAAVVAIGRDRELGSGNKLLWHIPDDLKRFRRLTEGHPIIMGRKTFESIVGYVGGPLPNRTNIVVTRDRSYTARQGLAVEGLAVEAPIFVAHSLDKAIAIAKAQPGAEEIYIGGGAELYKQALPMIDTLYLTLVDASAEADAFFPEYEKEFTKKVFEESHEWKGLKYTWIDLERE